MDALKTWVESHGTEKPKLINMYGITETTVHATFYPITNEDISRGGASPLGSPLPDLNIYLLDQMLRPVGAGIPGEIYISGAGVSKGYWNNTLLTDNKFIKHPDLPNEPLYKSGDLALRNQKDQIIYLKRLDNQIKIRGYRVELGDIEAVLQKLPGVKKAVAAIKHHANQSVISAYLVADNCSPEDTATLNDELVEAWESIYEQEYDSGSQKAKPDITRDFQGWNSSFTGKPIPQGDMDEWLAETLKRINCQAEDSILEVGCGSGLLMYPLLDQCKHYQGLDFSKNIIDRHRKYLKDHDIKHALVSHGHADKLTLLLPSKNNVVTLGIINSVIQYFPDLSYLDKVLDQTIRKMSGGRLFIGDVRDYRLLTVFNTRISLFQYEMSLKKGLVSNMK